MPLAHLFYGPCSAPALLGMRVPSCHPHQSFTIEPAGVVWLCSETRTPAQAAEDGEVPAHEVCGHPGIQFFSCRQGKGCSASGRLSGWGVRASGALGLLGESVRLWESSAL